MQAFDQHLHEDAADGQSDETKDADRFAPLVDEHDGEREQEDGGRDDRHDGDGQMEALEHAEGSGRSGGFARRPRDDAWHARVDVAREGPGVSGIGQRDVDARDVLGARPAVPGDRVRSSRSGRCSRTSRGTAPRRDGSGVGS